MNRLLVLLLVALGGCNPVGYVPTPISVAPRAAGVWASGSVNSLAAQATGELAVAPVPGVAVLARGVYGNTDVLASEPDDGTYVQRGAEVGAVTSLPLSPGATVELGAALGRDRLDAQNGTFDIGCCSRTFRPLAVTTTRVAGHAGLWLGAPDGTQSGPTLRVTRVSTRVREATDDTAASVGVFLEPTIRVRSQSGPLELTVQVGLSLPTQDDYRTDFSHVPFLGSVGLAYRLHAFGE